MKLPMRILAAIGATCCVGLLCAEDIHPITHRRIAQVMGSWLVRPERQSEEHPHQALGALDIKRDSVVADIGAGVGYYTWHLAERVGPKGTAYGENIQQEMLDGLAKTMQEHHLTNIRPVLGNVADPRLPANANDLVLLVDVYHEFSEPEKCSTTSATP